MGQQPSTPQPGKQLRVIGAGLSRTGTASFSAALGLLLDGPVYHGGTQTTLGDPIEIKSWIRIIRLWLNPSPQDNESARSMMKDRLDGYVAVTDSPGGQFTPELLELYPDAIVICTVRDPHAWFKSMGQTAGLATLWFLRVVLLPLPGMRHFTEYIKALTAQWVRVYGKDWPSVELYHQHIEWLKEVVPEERLVFFDVKEGWAPLCKALGKEIPADIPFPRLNDSAAIDRVAQYHVRRGLVRWAAGLAVVGVVAGYTWWA
ncbi:P-loop containing nucleoside triphosphate hydrolase protein [Aspergillus pseudoustus]|uniref:P-loop containing nucleoside triphosphate hydrolase protein n=1 Tax=Aspergillus pseudoustus TaxID=1810923 RepID=A0ABR4JLI2_9EURO